MNNTIGHKFILTITGSSHGKEVGGKLENCPKGLIVDNDYIARELDRRRPQKYGTSRIEDDCVHFLSGIADGRTDGTSIEFRVVNHNIRKEDYDSFKGWFRPSHADYPYFVKYGQDSLKYKDMASARMFLPVVVAGCFAKMFLQQRGIVVNAIVTEIGGIDYLNDREQVENLLKEVTKKQDTVAGKIRCEVNGVGVGLGEPIFEKLSANLAKAMMNVPSAVSFSLGDISYRDRLLGSQDIDLWKEDFTTVTNHSGGLNAGLTNGMPIVFSVGFHAIHTLSQRMTLINEKGQLQIKEIGGRHDTCQLLRTPVIVESLAAMVVTDFILMNDKKN
ncbi:MAG: chorismate synthase [Bacteroidales bacterium]